jgi:hypothetical protein
VVLRTTAEKWEPRMAQMHSKSKDISIMVWAWHGFDSFKAGSNARSYSLWSGVSSHGFYNVVKHLT